MSTAVVPSTRSNADPSSALRVFNQFSRDTTSSLSPPPPTASTNTDTPSTKNTSANTASASADRNARTRRSVLGTWSNSPSSAPPPVPTKTSIVAALNATKEKQPAKEKSWRGEPIKILSTGEGDEEFTRNSYLSVSDVHAKEGSDTQLSLGLAPAGDGSASHLPRKDKAAQILGIPHRSSMEPVPARKRMSIVSSRSVPPPSPSHVPTLPLASLYVVSGLPKRPQTWTLADPDAVQGLTHSDGAVSRWWRAEVLGSTVSPGVGGGKKKKVMKGHSSQTEVAKGPGALTKQETAKMLSKALKLSFTREVEIIASTLQPASTVHTFTFTLPAPATPLAPPSTLGLSALRNSVLSGSTDNNRFSNALSSYGTFPYSYADTHARPSSAYLGPTSVTALDATNLNSGPDLGGAGTEGRGAGSVTYHGVCLTVWSHADAERSAAIRHALESMRSRKESAHSVVASRIKALRTDAPSSDPVNQARRSVRNNRRGPWSVADGETDGESEGDGAVSESEFDVASTSHGPGESTLFLTGDTVFWLPYALTLVSRHPIYDLMRDYLTLSWARFSKDVASHTLQISKILSHPAPRAGDIVRLDASPKEGGEKGDGSLEVLARFPGGLDFGRGLVDINFTMWPLFKCLNIDNILSICEIALAPTGRILFFSRNPAMLGIAVATIKYLVELRGWNGIALPAVHARDARIYIEDPGPWIIGMAAEMRYAVRTPPEVCVCDLDINYLSCASPPVGCLSVKQQRDRYRQKILAAFGEYYHPDHSVPIEFKEAFPAGRFRPICKIQAKRGASSSVVAESIKAPEWWHSTRIIQAFDSVLQDRFKKPSLFKRISSFGSYKRPQKLTGAEQQVQHSIRKRATAFVDARDDLETKIGRLSRRLNFLMTESDLWREKFVTFEQYAEKLSSEASELRAKISKEQRESKRLTGLVSHTAQEKLKLETQLYETESAHKEAVVELEKMRSAMEKMEEERAQLVAEVEAQIERALASMSMAVEMDESSDFSQDERSALPRSRPSSAPTSRRPSNAALRSPPMRAFSTESTLAETDEETMHPIDAAVSGDEALGNESSQKRTNCDSTDRRNDAMNALDEGIHTNSDRIAQKVLQIQQKLETALADRRHWRPSLESETEGSETSKGAERSVSPTTTRRSAFTAVSRTRSDTTSSSQTATRTKRILTSHGRAESDHSMTPKTVASPALPQKPLDTSDDLSKPNSPVTLSSETSTFAPSTPAATFATTEDSDTDFQSAYSTSPRGSYYDSDSGHVQSTNLNGEIIKNDTYQQVPPQTDVTNTKKQGNNHVRERASSGATTIAKVSTRQTKDFGQDA